METRSGLRCAHLGSIAADRSGLVGQARGQLEGLRKIGMRGIEAGEIFDNLIGEREVGLADPLDHTFREFVGAVVIVVGGIFAVLVEGDRR